MKHLQVELSGVPGRLPARAEHHVTVDETDGDGRLFARCKAGCGRVAVESFDRVDQARRLLDAISKAKGERGEHGVMLAAEAPRRRKPRQRRLFG
jgi:hypothetical protein